MTSRKPEEKALLFDPETPPEKDGGKDGVGRTALAIGVIGFLVLGFIGALSLGFNGCGGESKITDPSDLRFVVAEADGGKFKMTRSMLNDALARRLSVMKRKTVVPTEEERPYLTRMVVQEAVFQYKLAQMMAATVVPDLELQIKEEMDVFKGQFPTQAIMDEALAKSQLTWDSYHEFLRLRILRQAAIQKHLKPYTPTEDEIDEYYMVHSRDFIAPPAIRYSQILFRVPRLPSSASEERKAEFAANKVKLLKDAEAVREKLVQGADFAAMAREHSDDVSSRDKGGDAGYVREGEELPEVYKVVSTSKINELTPVFESEYGYHIIKVTESAPAGFASRASARPAIVKILKEMHNRNAAQVFVKQVLADAKIVFYVPVADKPPAKDGTRPARVAPASSSGSASSSSTPGDLPPPPDPPPSALP